MREIKFRAWDREGVRMYHDVGVIPPHYKPARIAEDGMGSLHTNHNSTPLIPYNTNRYEIMQYTGLTDRNGVEIYEGDIVETDKSSINRSRVSYSEAQYPALLWAGDQGVKESERIEVIGNIYENPELLNGNKE